MTTDDRETPATELTDESLLQQHMAVGWYCDHEFSGATCATCFRNIDHAAAIAAGALAARAKPAPSGGEREAQAGPPPQADVDALRDLLDLMENFTDNDQRARYLLTCNWMRDRDARNAATETRERR